MNDRDVTVVIPTIPPRELDMLPRAIRSVAYQEEPVAALAIAIDVRKEGAWATRQRALDMATTPWVAFLDDDDEFLPMHTRLLLDCAEHEAADYVFSYYTLAHCFDVLGTFGKPFDHADPHHTTMTVLVRTKLAQSVGFTPPLPEHTVGGEDWRFTLGCVDAGAKIVHVPVRTWHWHHHFPGNTSGRPDRW